MEPDNLVLQPLGSARPEPGVNRALRRTVAQRRQEVDDVVSPSLDELPEHAHIRPDDEFGPTDLHEIVSTFPADGSVYCCGPTPMLDAVRHAFASRRLHFERFPPPPIVDGRLFAMVLRRSGVTLQVPADRSALDVLEDLRPTVPHSCRQGFCGTCEVNGVRICVARPTNDRLVLDL